MHRTIPAKSKEDAIQQFNQQANDAFDRGSSSDAPKKKLTKVVTQVDSDEFVVTYVEDVFVDDIVVESS